ncbi:MAG: hypothetical protein CMP10_00425 [Zetaproteobacteria bacterium]|nr:hypothetical protein [Pseudobdellovibrionaceae bacterium]|tara:strand:- start:7686 stop:8087 length:402 start_codon:yes stop_codon:yes gene_type:complete
MAGTRVSRGFKDISFSFSPHPITKDLPVLTNERAIVRSVRNLVETIPTERFFNPLIGSSVRASLFENMSPTLVAVIEDQIIQTVTNFEPRVDNIHVNVDGRPERNALNVTVFFDVVGLSVPTQSFNFLLESTR